MIDGDQLGLLSVVVDGKKTHRRLAVDPSDKKQQDDADPWGCAYMIHVF